MFRRSKCQLSLAVVAKSVIVAFTLCTQKEFFADYDPLRAGTMSEAKFRTALQASNVIPLKEEEVQCLTKRYKQGNCCHLPVTCKMRETSTVDDVHELVHANYVAAHA